MKFRSLSLLSLLLAVAVSFPACQSAEKKSAEELAATTTPDMPDRSGDVSFQSFVGRLRAAVAKRDAIVLASMMTPNFGYDLDQNLSGAGVFAFWDQNGLWEELGLVVNEKWVPFETYMVAPSPGTAGYHAGVTRVGGSWKFIYFVKG